MIDENSNPKPKNRQSATKKSTFNEITMMVDLDSRESYVKFLNQIKNLGMIKEKYHYLLVTLVSLLLYLRVTITSYLFIL